MLNVTSAVYKITNRINGKIYIGIVGGGRTVRQRWREHSWRAAAVSAARRTHFHNAIRAHGADAFDVSILESGLSERELFVAEKKWIAHFRSSDHTAGYNSNEGGGAFPMLTDEQRKRLADRNRTPQALAKLDRARAMRVFDESYRAALSKAHIGIRPSDETRAKMSAAHKKRFESEEVRAAHSERLKGRVFPDEVRRKIRESNLGKKRTHVVTDEMRAKYRAAALKRWHGVPSDGEQTCRN